MKKTVLITPLGSLVALLLMITGLAIAAPQGEEEGQQADKPNKKSVAQRRISGKDAKKSHPVPSGTLFCPIFCQFCAEYEGKPDCELRN